MTKLLYIFISQVLEHVKNLKMEVSPDIDPIEAAATIKVREQMGKLTPYLPDVSIITK